MSSEPSSKPDRGSVHLGGVFEDALLVPPWTAGQYVVATFMAWQTSQRWMWLRLLRTLVSGGVQAVPAIAGGWLIWMWSLPLERQRELLSSTWRPDDTMAAMNVPLNVATLMAAFVVVLTMVGMRGWVDSVWFSRLRAPVDGGRIAAGLVVRASVLGFAVLALLRAGLFMGSVMFLSPFFRVVGRLAAMEGSTGRATVFLLVSVLVSALVLAYLSFFLQVAAAHLVWRPRFLAGTVVAAMAAPFRQWDVYRWVLPGWILWWVASWSAMSWLVSLAMGTWTADAAVRWPWMMLGAAAGVVFWVGAWWECFLVTIVGQRLGDVKAGVHSLRSATEDAQTPSMERAPDQTRFEPPVRGVFVAAGPDRRVADSIVSFADVLPEAGSEQWTTGNRALDTLLSMHESAPGVVELIQLPATESPIITWPEVVRRPVLAGISWSDEERRPLSQLAGEASRVVYMASSGAPESVWRPTTPE
jgi:hypothetical protein